MICRANQLTGLYMMGTLVVKGLITKSLLIVYLFLYSSTNLITFFMKCNFFFQIFSMLGKVLHFSEILFSLCISQISWRDHQHVIINFTKNNFHSIICQLFDQRFVYWYSKKICLFCVLNRLWNKERAE